MSSISNKPAKNRNQNSVVFSKALGEKIKEARTEYGLSQKSLAQALRVSDKAISSYEVGRTQPSIEILEKLSSLVHQPLSYFSTAGSTTETTIAHKLEKIEKELQEVKLLLKKQK